MNEIEQLKMYWPQAHIEYNQDQCAQLIIVPSFILGKGWNHTICTVLWKAWFAQGKMLSPLDGFYVDIPLKLASGKQPKYSRLYARSDDKPKKYIMHDGNSFEFGPERLSGYPQWMDLTRFWWRVQEFDPRRDTLMTSMNAIKRRLSILE